MKETLNPLISIIIPTYNAAENLAHCLSHLVSQTYQDKEILVIDGGSDDNTSSVIRQYRKHIAAVISEPDRGIYDALNKGCALANGHFLYFLGADDHLIDNLSSVAEHLQDPETVYYGDVVLGDSGKRYDGRFTAFKLARTNINQQAIFYPRAVFNTYQFSLTYPIQADWELNMRLWASATFTFQYIDMEIAVFSEQGLSSTSQDEAFNRDYLRLIKRSFPAHVYVFRKLLFSLLHLIKRIIPRALVNKLNQLQIRL